LSLSPLYILGFYHYFKLPEPIWTKNEAELFQWYKDRDLPVPIGGTWNFVGKKRRIAQW
jgi:hypothetical protein